MMESVVRHFKVDINNITRSQRGRVDENIPRWVVMYLAQQMCGLRLHEIANYMGLTRTGSIPTTIAKLKSRMATDIGLAWKVGKIKENMRVDTFVYGIV
jgi:chromosomal replication initiation ATPase DnaA